MYMYHHFYKYYVIYVFVCLLNPNTVTLVCTLKDYFTVLLLIILFNVF